MQLDESVMKLGESIIQLDIDGHTNWLQGSCNYVKGCEIGCEVMQLGMFLGFIFIKLVCFLPKRNMNVSLYP